MENSFEIKDDNYFQVCGFMINKLGLKGIDLCVYAVIYGFNKSTHREFHGTLSYIEKFTGFGRQPIIRSLKRLCEGGFLIKSTFRNATGLHCHYTAKLLYDEWMEEIEKEKKTNEWMSKGDDYPTDNLSLPDGQSVATPSVKSTLADKEKDSASTKIILGSTKTVLAQVPKWDLGSIKMGLNNINNNIDNNINNSIMADLPFSPSADNVASASLSEKEFLEDKSAAESVSTKSSWMYADDPDFAPVEKKMSNREYINKVFEELDVKDNVKMCVMHFYVDLEFEYATRLFCEPVVEFSDLRQGIVYLKDKNPSFDKIQRDKGIIDKSVADNFDKSFMDMIHAVY